MARFKTPLRVELIDHAANDGGGDWAVLSPLEYEDNNGRCWVVPAGFVTDFASVPRLPFAYMLFGNTGHAPAVLHDWLCRNEVVKRKIADKMFREAMEAVGMPTWRSWPMFRAVRAYSETVVGWFKGE